MTRETVTYCRICEPLCGLVATVEDGRLVKLRPDRSHPLSRGFACPKGIAFTSIQNDPDRVLHPLKRGSDGTFERVSWDDAMSDIIGRLRAVVAEHGPDALGCYFGNPIAFDAAHVIGALGFLQCLGSPHNYSAGTQDIMSRNAASRFLYGTQFVWPVPDLERTDLLVVVGANPIISHGSAVSAPRMKESLLEIVKRGGRVVVIDPRRTETAATFEWLPITPDGDAFMLLSLLHVMFEDGLVDLSAIAGQASGVESLREMARPFPPEATVDHHGIPESELRDLARALVSTERAAIYGRTGTCLGRSATLTNFLLDAVNLVAGNLDREGGAMFGNLGIPGQRIATRLIERLMPIGYANGRSRVGGHPHVLGTAPAAFMAKEITTPGKGRMRAMVVTAGNPVLSVPNGDELEAALEQLDLLVSIDLYVNETNAHAHYILPATTMYERDDFPIVWQAQQTTPFRQATERVLEPAGEARSEWEVFEQLILGLRTATPLLMVAASALRAARLLRLDPHPRWLIDAVIRLADGGDRFGFRAGGLSRRKLLRDHPHGKVLADHLRPGMLRKVALTRGRKVSLDVPEMWSEISGLHARRRDPELPFMLIGMRELRSENSWMHNVPKLMSGGRRHLARMHADDAADLGVGQDDRIRIVSRHGAVEIPVTLTDDIKRGVVAVPHGWGHKGTGGWRRANETPGVNVNELMSTAPEDVERLAGMSHLNGVPIRVELAARAAHALPDPVT